MARRFGHHSSLSAWGFALLGVLVAPQLGCGESKEEPESTSVSQIVYAVRQHTVADGDNVEVNVSGGMGQVMDYKRFVPGGRLELLDLTTGDIQNIIEDEKTADIASVDVSYDATKVLFSMKRDESDSYNLYWANLKPNEAGKFEVHQLTNGDFDQLHAIWLPGDRIAFISDVPYTEMGTRADEYNHAAIVTQVSTTTLDGGDADVKLCSQNLSHTINLFALSDGRVGFSRWEHLENVNDVKMFAMNPDCTQMTAIAGQHSKPSNSLVQVAEGPDPNTFIAVGTSRENTIQAGTLVYIDARGDESRPNEETAAMEVLTPSVPRDEERSPVGRYRSPTYLPDGRILTSWADGDVNEYNEFTLTAPDFGIYLYDLAARQNQYIINHAETWELYAKPVVVRDEPPVIPSIQNSQDSTLPTTFGSADVKQTSLYSLHGETVSGAQFEDTPMDEALAHAVKVRIIEGFSSESAPGTTMFGLTMAEGAALIGEAPVYGDGSWSAEIPPFIPVHLQAVDEFDLAIRNQTTWVQGMPGEDRQCGGCHEDRTEPFDIPRQQLPDAVAAGAENFMIPVADRTEYPWANATDSGNTNQIQQLLDAYCVSCHNETTNGDGAQTFYTVSMTEGETTTSYEIPRLDLSSRPITVTYDNNTEAWPASYVSIFYPAAMEMEMDDLMVTGEIPPKWGIPSDARGSALIEKLNVTSSKDPEEHAWALGEAFSHEGLPGTRTDHATEVGLPREELLKLIRAIDMGGQYYARQNSAFQAYALDPLSR